MILLNTFAQLETSTMRNVQNVVVVVVVVDWVVVVVVVATG